MQPPSTHRRRLFTRKTHSFAVALLTALCVAPTLAQRSNGPFFPVAVTYDPGTKSPDGILGELQALRAQGFNAIAIASQRDSLRELAAKSDLDFRQLTIKDVVAPKTRLTPPELRLWAWSEMARGARAITFNEPSDTAAAFARVVTRNPALFVPLRPRSPSPEVRIDGGEGAIAVEFLESPDVIVMIGLNRSDRTHRVTMTFPPDTQEAIWQNMETGASVNFVAGTNGPTYTYRFAPHDLFVLMIRRAIR